MRIGVDIDGVLADSMPLWVDELNRYFNKNKRVKEIHLYDICQTYEISEQDLYQFLKTRGPHLMSRPLPVQDAPHYLNVIKQTHEIYIVTARDERYRQETGEWLQNHSLPYDELLLLGSHDKIGPCLENNLKLLVEDTLEIGLQVSAAGVPVLLLDAPYNQGALPELVYRKRSWQEIYHAIINSPAKIRVT